MIPELFVKIAIRPALELLPQPMNSIEAQALLIAIAYQESELQHRRQRHGGPARGYLQFERAGVHGVLTHPASAKHAAAACQRLDVPARVETVYEAIEHQDVLACAFARLLLWTSPRALPTSEQPDHGWREYLATWRPGKPRESEWAGNFGRGWDVTRMVRA